ncbi:MAG: serine/threonine protein kinase [Cytophagales bacterium CG12_big_fil_rev_8_21_14_0_65_40_12]|nr:MAG: serine/threonine protein kinase [Cytophagales bacterium CG12_big_fil_rev_8_21_14_0_65_40_12]PIW05641.1 MAG: serine/threonine protein kinase [Cytophagales bacterium CG17_big_fil_post_rev_8_21_14_2_50_40_13]
MLFQRNNIWLSKGKKVYLNTVRHDNIDYLLTQLNPDHEKSKGGNSNVFAVKDPNTEDEYVIKFCKFDIDNAQPWMKTRIARFEREIDALQTAKEANCGNVIDFKFSEYKTISNKKFHFYVMEKADLDLTSYLEAEDLSDQMRFQLCTYILEGIQQLHKLGIYHRDIKPDNILRVNGTWKIGDLGLVAYREPDFEIDEIGERIGPIGWLSPEAMNKFFNEGLGKKNTHGFDCKLDEKSDIFQLGKLFWFIFQGNIPIGQIRRADFKLKDKTLYDLILTMLRHSKENRLSIQEIEDGFKTRYSHYGI